MKCKGGPFCEDCAWQKESLEDPVLTPCDVCIRNPEMPSKRTIPKEANIQGVNIEVPRDMYISIDMFEILKVMLDKQKGRIKELESLIALLQLRKMVEKNPPTNPWDKWMHPDKWIIKFQDTSFESSSDSIRSESNFTSWASTKKIWKKSLSEKDR